MQAPETALWQPAAWAKPLPVTAGASLTAFTDKDRGFNLAKHVDADPAQTERNRQKLQESTGLTNDWLWLNQVHGAQVAEDDSYRAGMDADAVISRNPAKTAVVMTADCVPVLLSSADGREVAAIHAGWPGLHKRIITATLAKMRTEPAAIFAYIGPCAGAARYEVDEAFYQRFVEQDPKYAQFFRANRTGHYLADISSMARHELEQGGVPAAHITGGEACSITENQYFSHRRDGARAGRMASFIAPKQS